MKNKKPVSGEDERFVSIRQLARSIEALNAEALRVYSPVVEDIVQTGSRDDSHIEHTLDGLLDFCGYAPVLLLYKKLCRHYLTINPSATASYVSAYREMWGASSPQKAKRANRRNPGES